MRVFILCYHKVGPESAEGRRLNIAPENLRTHVEFFYRRGFRFLRASEIGDAFSKPPKKLSSTSSSTSSRFVCFTFDDAYASTLKFGQPIFDVLGLPATFYAVSERVGGDSSWDGDQARPLADWQALRDARAGGHEIGNHTATHPRLADLPVDEQRKEIKLAHDRLRDEGMEPRSFCYPYGSYDVTSRGVLEEVGYSVGLALDKRVANREDDMLRLPRVVLAFSDRLPMLLYKLHLRPLIRG